MQAIWAIASWEERLVKWNQHAQQHYKLFFVELTCTFVLLQIDLSSEQMVNAFCYGAEVAAHEFI